jgi:predicted dehydrogenase
MGGDRDRATIGIVGLGTHGIEQAEHLTELGPDVIGADASPEARRQFEERFRTNTYQTPDDLYERNVDGVIITTPNKFHETAAVAAFEAGLDVFIEKPLAHTLESARRIRDAARESDGDCMVGFFHRFVNHCRILNAYIESGFLGEITHVQATFRRRRGIPGRGTWYTSREIAGGGALIDIGVHAIDLLLSFLDFPALRNATGRTRTEFGNDDDYTYLEMYGEDAGSRMFDVDDSATALLEFAGGRTATLEVAWAANTSPTHRYLVRGTDAGAMLDLTDLTSGQTPVLAFHEARDLGDSHFVDAQVTANSHNPFRRQLEAFLDMACRGNSPDRNTVGEALRVQQVVDRLYRESDAESSGDGV